MENEERSTNIRVLRYCFDPFGLNMKLVAFLKVGTVSGPAHYVPKLMIHPSVFTLSLCSGQSCFIFIFVSHCMLQRVDTEKSLNIDDNIAD